MGVGVLLHAPVNLRHAHKAYPRLQKETCASTSLLALLNNTGLGKGGPPAMGFVQGFL